MDGCWLAVGNSKAKKCCKYLLSQMCILPPYAAMSCSQPLPTSLTTQENTPKKLKYVKTYTQRLRVTSAAIDSNFYQLQIKIKR